VLSFTKYINELIIKINGFIVFQIHKTTAIMTSIPGILSFKKQSSINNMLLLNSLVQTEQTFTIDNSSTITLNHITVNAQVTVDEEFHNHIRRIMKKSLPPSIQIQFLFASKSVNMFNFSTYKLHYLFLFFTAYCQSTGTDVINQ